MSNHRETSELDHEHERTSRTSMTFPGPDTLRRSVLGIQDDGDSQNQLTTAGAGVGCGLPQVWVRLRPSPQFNDNIFEIGDDGMTLKLLVDPKEDRFLPRITNYDFSKPPAVTFNVDGILRNSSQVDTYSSIVDDVVFKVMSGIPGIVILIGPEVSGKSFTLFGYPKRYEHRGVIPRALERIFEVVEMNREKVQYKIQMRIVEIRQNRIKDLLTMATSEILRIGQTGPQGMYYKEITSVEDGLALMWLALSGQKGIPREGFAKYHTLVFVDIHGETDSEEGEQSIDSRLTFCKIASIPTRPRATETQKSIAEIGLEQIRNLDGCRSGRPCTTVSHAWAHPSKAVYQRPKYCCQLKDGPIGEAIQIRRDLFLLEQMFTRSNELRRLNKFYSRVARAGMVMLTRRPNPAPSSFFRQCKLAHCLQDIVSGTTEIRVIVTIRPEKQFLHSALEAMKFADKVKGVPIDIQLSQKPISPYNASAKYGEKKLREELMALYKEHQLEERTGVKIHLNNPSIHRKRIIEAQDFLEGRISEIKLRNRDQVQAMFETIRQMWKFAAEQDWKKEKEKAKEEDHQDQDARQHSLPRAASSQPQVMRSFSSLESETLKKRKRSSRGAHVSITEKRSAELLNGATDKLMHELPLDVIEEEDEEEEEDDEYTKFGMPRATIVIPPLPELQPLDPLHLPESVQLDVPNIYKVLGQKEPSTKEESWDAFLKTMRGLSQFEELTHENDSFLDQIILHNEIAVKLRTVLINLAHLLRAFNGILEEEPNPLAEVNQSSAAAAEGDGNDKATVDANILVPTEKELMEDIKALEHGRDELLEKLNIVRSQAVDQRKIVGIRRKQLEKEFVKFSQGRFGITFAKDESAIPVTFADEFTATTHEHVEEKESLVQNYEILRLNARKQAKQLLRAFYCAKPAWNY